MNRIENEGEIRNRVIKAIRVYQIRMNTEAMDVCIMRLLTDLRHFTAANGIVYDAADIRAEMTYEKECGQ